MLVLSIVIITPCASTLSFPTSNFCGNCVRNLSIAGKKKQAGKQNYVSVKPELVKLDENLANLGMDNEQLIALAMLVGTDYNVGGIKGIGPKKIERIRKYVRVG